MIAARDITPSTGVLGTLDRGLAGLELAVTVVSLAVALLVPLYAILMRVALVPTGEWVIELPTEMLVLMSIYGSGVALARHGHMHVGFLVARLEEPVARVAAVLVQILVLGVSLLITLYGFGNVRQIAQAGLRSQELFGVPVALFAAASAVGFLGWTVHSAIGLVHLLRPESRAASTAGVDSGQSR